MSDKRSIKEVIPLDYYNRLQKMDDAEYKSHAVVTTLYKFTGSSDGNKVLNAIDKNIVETNDFWKTLSIVSKDFFSEDEASALAYAIKKQLEGKPGDQQPLYDVTEHLKNSIDPKKGCRMFAEAIKEGKRVYAFKGPALHKWKKDEKGHIEKVIGKDGKFIDFKMDLNDALIFYSTLCTPYTDPYDLSVMDLRFIADTEVLDIAEDYKKRLEELVEEKGKKARDKRRKYEKRLSGEDSCCYGIHLNEVTAIREIVKPVEGEAVYFMTSSEKMAKKTINSFVYMHNEMKSGYSPVMLLLVPRLVVDKYRNYLTKKEHNKQVSTVVQKLKELDVSKLSNSEKMGLFDELSGEETDRDRVSDKLFALFNRDTHDKIPHSYIASILKSGELTTLMRIARKEEGSNGLKGFTVIDKEINSKYLSKFRDKAIFAAILPQIVDNIVENFALNEGYGLDSLKKDQKYLENERLLIRYFAEKGFGGEEDKD
jgi:hypothetical protein